MGGYWLLAAYIFFDPAPKAEWWRRVTHYARLSFFREKYREKFTIRDRA
jgi:hypothetical protein